MTLNDFKMLNLCLLFPRLLGWPVCWFFALRLCNCHRTWQAYSLSPCPHHYTFPPRVCYDINDQEGNKPLLTAGIGSDHRDLKAAAATWLTTAEVTRSNVVPVAKDELMRILVLVWYFLPGYHKLSINGK
jgi:hypothetical protein